MTLLTHLPVIVSTFLLGVLGLVFLYYTFKVPYHSKIGMSSFIFISFGIMLLSLLKLYTDIYFSFEKMFGLLLIIFLIWLVVGLIIKSVLIKRLR
jgi:hypothetical protein